MNNSKLTVLFPVRNEVRSLEMALKVLVAIQKDLVGEILVIVDDPIDQSLIVASMFLDFPCIRFVVNTDGVGVFNAISFGVKVAKYDKILILVADEILPTLKLEEFASALNYYDFVSATRYKNGGKRYGGNYIGRGISFVANKILSLRFLNKISDATTGIKGFHKKHWEILSKNADGVGWSCAMQFCINAYKSRISYAEIPVISVDRPFDGVSTFKLWSWIFGYTRKLIKS